MPSCRDPLVTNGDDSLGVYRQALPGGDKVATWLPVRADAINLTLRMYWTEEAILDGTWNRFHKS
jgi:hypothetical protein